MPLLSEDLAFRGLVHQVSDKVIFDRLDRGEVTAYIGFDPTSDSLHVGNLLQLCNLRRLQIAGNRPIVLAGGGTGLIGDPGGKTDERPLLDREELEKNLDGISRQLERFLDFSPESGKSQAVLLNNAVWLAEYPLIDFLRDIGKHFSVNQMIGKESVRSRIERPEQGISFTEFSYMLLQAYDFLYLFDHEQCTLQMGASDQWGNITAGIDLIRRLRASSAFALTSPLVVKPDGTKFGKSEQGALYLDPTKTSPFALYQYFVRSEDTVVGTYLRYFTFLDHDAIAALEESVQLHPETREAQKKLASEVCGLVHGEQETRRVEEAVEALYSTSLSGLDEDMLLSAFADAPSSVFSRSILDDKGLDIADALFQCGLVGSKGAARTAIAQGGAYLNNRRVLAGEAIQREDLIADRYVVLRRGRRELHLLSFQ